MSDLEIGRQTIPEEGRILCSLELRLWMHDEVDMDYG
jgi:hypothetical protein